MLHYNYKIFFYSTTRKTILLKYNLIFMECARAHARRLLNLKKKKKYVAYPYNDLTSRKIMNKDQFEPKLCIGINLTKCQEE